MSWAQYIYIVGVSLSGREILQLIAYAVGRLGIILQREVTW